MENMLHIGAKLDKETADNAASAIATVFNSAYETRQTDDVILKALDVLKSAVTVQHVNIQNCTFDNDQSKTVEVVVPSDYDLKA